MSTTGGVGQGITFGLSVDTTIGRVRNIQMPEHTSEPVDFSSLEETTWMKFLPASLTDPGQFVIEIFFNTEIARPTINTVQVATFTWAVAQTSGNTTKATFTASGFVTSLAYPNVAIAEPLIETITFKCDGIGTVPAFTLEAA